MPFKIRNILLCALLLGIIACGNDNISFNDLTDPFINSGQEQVFSNARPELNQQRSNGPQIDSITPNSLPLSGGEIYISGSKFISGNSVVEVIIRGVPIADIIDVSPNSIRAIAPRAPVLGPVDVLIRTSMGEVVLAGGITYQGPEVLAGRADSDGNLKARGFTSTAQGLILFWTDCSYVTPKRYELLDGSLPLPGIADSFDSIDSLVLAGLIDEVKPLWEIIRREGFCPFLDNAIIAGRTNMGNAVNGNVVIMGGVYIYGIEIPPDYNKYDTVDPIIKEPIDIVIDDTMPKLTPVVYDEIVFKPIPEYTPTTEDKSLMGEFYYADGYSPGFEYVSPPNCFFSKVDPQPYGYYPLCESSVPEIYYPPPDYTYDYPTHVYPPTRFGDYRGPVSAAVVGAEALLLDAPDLDTANELARVSVDGRIRDAVIEGDWLVVDWADSDWSSLWISWYNISDPTNPLLVSTLQAPEGAVRIGDVLHDGGFAYISFLYSGDVSILWVIDFINPSAPVSIGTVELPCKAYGLVSTENYIYAAAGECGLLSLTNPK